MSKPNIIVERIKAHRADLVVKIQEADADIATREVRRNALSVELGNPVLCSTCHVAGTSPICNTVAESPHERG